MNKITIEGDNPEFWKHLQYWLAIQKNCEGIRYNVPASTESPDVNIFTLSKAFAERERIRNYERR